MPSWSLLVEDERGRAPSRSPVAMTRARSHVRLVDVDVHVVGVHPSGLVLLRRRVAGRPTRRLSNLEVASLCSLASAALTSHLPAVHAHSVHARRPLKVALGLEHGDPLL